MNDTALFRLSCGLYVLTAHADGRDNGCIINSAMQVTSAPPITGVVSVNKQNYTHGMILKNGRFNISVLTIGAPFDLFKHFGFQSGATVNKFAGYSNAVRSDNGILYLTKYVNAYLSFQVTDIIDFGTHTMFKAYTTNGGASGKIESLTYAHYHQFIKPKPLAPAAKITGYRCNICGYVHESEDMPDNFVCLWCQHGASDFVKITEA